MHDPTLLPPWVDELYHHLKLKRWLKAEELPHDDVVQATDQHSAPFTSTKPGYCGELPRDTPGDTLDSAKKTATCLSPSTTTYWMTTWSRIWLWSGDELGPTVAWTSWMTCTGCGCNNSKCWAYDWPLHNQSLAHLKSFRVANNCIKSYSFFSL